MEIKQPTLEQFKNREIEGMSRRQHQERHIFQNIVSKRRKLQQLKEKPIPDVAQMVSEFVCELDFDTKDIYLSRLFDIALRHGKYYDFKIQLKCGDYDYDRIEAIELYGCRDESEDEATARLKRHQENIDNLERDISGLQTIWESLK